MTVNIFKEKLNCATYTGIVRHNKPIDVNCCITCHIYSLTVNLQKNSSTLLYFMYGVLVNSHLSQLNY